MSLLRKSFIASFNDKKNFFSYLEYYTSLFWNAFTIISIAWFILSIEFTLSWNNIQGVNSIDNTGQLIPFVIGCVSTVQVIKKVTLLLLAKVSSSASLPVSSHFSLAPSRWLWSQVLTPNIEI